MVQPAPRMIKAPVKNNAVVPITALGEAIGVAIGAAINVEKRQGKNR